MQALWALLTALPVYAANAVAHQPALGVTDVVGVVMWCVGLVVETVADSQKKAFRRQPANRHKWINTGLWAWSRHPNYCGEMLLWAGAAVLCCGCFRESSQLAAAVAGPAFTAFLLLCVSGVPMLEKAADAKWGQQAAYVRYKQTTPMVLLRPPKRHAA